MDTKATELQYWPLPVLCPEALEELVEHHDLLLFVVNGEEVSATLDRLNLH